MGFALVLVEVDALDMDTTPFSSEVGVTDGDEDRDVPAEVTLLLLDSVREVGVVCAWVCVCVWD